MNYYILRQSETNKGNPIVCGSNLDKLKIDIDIFKRCQAVDTLKNEIIYDPGEEMFDGIPEDFVRNGDFLPIISQRVIDVLKTNGIDDIQYIPVQVVDLKGKRYDGYKLANILTALSDTIDKEKSNMEIRSKNSHFGSSGKIEFVWHYAINGERAAGHDIFRLKFDDEFEKEYSNCIFVSERFRKIIKENNFTGVTFSKITTVTAEKVTDIQESNGGKNRQKRNGAAKKARRIKGLTSNFDIWLDGILSSSDFDCMAIYFNLYKLAENENYAIELCTYSEYDPYDADWYYNNKIYSSSDENNDFRFAVDGGYEACLQNVESLIKGYLNRSEKLIDCKTIIYGFNDGDVYFIKSDE